MSAPLSLPMMAPAAEAAGPPAGRGVAASDGAARFDAVLDRIVARARAHRDDRASENDLTNASQQGQLARGANANERAAFRPPTHETTGSVVGPSDAAPPTEPAVHAEATAVTADVDVDATSYVAVPADQPAPELVVSPVVPAPAADAAPAPDDVDAATTALAASLVVLLDVSQAARPSEAQGAAHPIPDPNKPAAVDSTSDAALPAASGAIDVNPSGDLRAGPLVDIPASVQPLAAASPLSGSDEGSMNVAMDATTQVAAEAEAVTVRTDTPSAPTVTPQEQVEPAEQASASSDRDVRAVGRRADGAPVLLGPSTQASAPVPAEHAGEVVAGPHEVAVPSADVAGEAFVEHDEHVVFSDADSTAIATSLVADRAVDDSPVNSPKAQIAHDTTQAATQAVAAKETVASPLPAAGLARALEPMPPSHGSAVVQRLADVARALENAPPPRSVVVELESMRGLRLEVRIGETGAVHVLARGSQDAVQPLAALGRDLADALEQRGMDFGGFEARDEDGNEQTGEAGDRSDQGRAHGRFLPDRETTNDAPADRFAARRTGLRL